MNKAVKTIVSILLLFVIAALVWVIVKGIRKPVLFEKEVARREAVAIQRMKDLRDLENAYKSVNGRFMASFDTLKNFYENGKMEVVMQVGSSDDSAAVANTQKIKRANPRITAREMYDLYKQGQNLVFSIKNELPVKDTLFHSRKDFNIDSLQYIPFSGKEKVEMAAEVKKVSGVDVPLFEAKMPYKKLLKGLDNQLRINLDAARRESNRYEGLQVGSITAPNNNAGNWE